MLNYLIYFYIMVVDLKHNKLDIFKFYSDYIYLIQNILNRKMSFLFFQYYFLTLLFLFTLITSCAKTILQKFVATIYSNKNRKHSKETHIPIILQNNAFWRREYEC